MDAKYITPAVTAFDHEGHVDMEANKRIYQWLIEGGMDGILILGSIGEFFAIPMEEKKRMIQEALDYVDHRVTVYVGTGGTVFEECVELSKRVAQRIWDELKVPSFLYEDSATRPERRNLATCRKGEFEGMPEKLLQEEWAPDYGERKIHPTAGITAIGARMPLVAFNINLATSDVEVAKKIAKVIRGSSGGFRSCKAMGFMMEDRGIAQVSMNMVNYEDTPLYVVYEQVRALAERYGTYIVDSEIVGLTPAKAMIDCAEFYLKARDFNCHNQIMEYHLLDMK